MGSAVMERIRPKHLIRRIMSLALAFAVGIGAGVAISILKPFGNETNEIEVMDVDVAITEEEFSLTIEHVEELVKPASELVSVKYFYKDANTYENVVTAFGVNIPFTTDKVVFTYEGVISLGIDLNEVQFSVDNAGKAIHVTLPAVTIMHNEIDAESFEYPYTTDSIFNSTGMEEYVNLIDTLQKAKAEEVMADTALLEEALQRAKDTITNILTVSDESAEYEIVFE